jgi:RNA polymerase sigma factor (sigma-70 family)
MQSLELAISSNTNELVQRSLSGDADSFQELYKRYAKAMYNTALRIVGNVADAEDILQEAFLDVFRNLDRFGYQSTFGAWLKQIVVNKSINLLKKRKLIVTELAGEVWDLADMDAADGESETLQIKGILKAMQRLPDGFRTALSLYLFEGYDHEEIAGILGVAHATVRTQYVRGKKRLLELIHQGGQS